jgi:hypothetical protein
MLTWPLGKGSRLDCGPVFVHGGFTKVVNVNNGHVGCAFFIFPAWRVIAFSRKEEGCESGLSSGRQKGID